MQKPYNEVVADLYRSVAGPPLATANAVGKTAGTVASGFGLFKAGQAINRIRKRKVDTDKLDKLHKLKTKARNRFGLRPGEYIDKYTGEIKTRGKSGGGFSLRKGFGNRSGRYNKFNKF